MTHNSRRGSAPALLARPWNRRAICVVRPLVAVAALAPMIVLPACVRSSSRVTPGGVELRDDSLTQAATSTRHELRVKVTPDPYERMLSELRRIDAERAERVRVRVLVTDPTPEPEPPQAPQPEPTDAPVGAVTPSTPQAAIVALMASSAIGATQPGDGAAPQTVDSLAELEAIIGSLPPGTGFEIEVVSTSDTGESGTRTRTGKASGAGLRTSSDEMAGAFNTQTPDVDLGDESATASGGGGWLDIELKSGGGQTVLYVIGALLIAAAVIPIVLRPRRLGLAAAMVGAGMLVIGAGVVIQSYPWVFLVAVLVVFIAIAWLAYEAWRRGRIEAAAKVITQAIEDYDRDEQVPVQGAEDDVTVPVNVGDRVKHAVADIAKRAGVTREVEAEVKRIKRKSVPGGNGGRSAPA